MAHLVALCMAILSAVWMFSPQLEGAVMRLKGPGNDTGPVSICSNDSWLLPNCAGKCTCASDRMSFYCLGCPSYGFDSQGKKCYIEKNERDSYPDCCMPKHICEGSDEYDESKYQASVEK